MARRSSSSRDEAGARAIDKGRQLIDGQGERLFR